MAKSRAIKYVHRLHGGVGITTVVGVIHFTLPVSHPTLTGLFLTGVPNTGSGIANTSNGTGDTGADSNGAY